MFIDSTLLRGYTQDEIDKMVNDLLLSVAEFSEIACMDGRGYGVKHLCDTCDLELDWCVRKEIIRLLIQSQDAAEDLLNFPVSERYITQTIEMSEFHREQLKFPGIEKVNVAEDVFDAYEEAFEVSPYIHQTLVLASSWIEFPSEFGSPNRMIFRDEFDNEVLKDDNNKIEYVDGDWRVRLQAMSEGSIINIQSCDWMIVTAPTVEPTEGVIEYIAPVYPNSFQRIPYVKSDVVGDDTRWWFRPHVLLDPLFYEEGANLAQAEFYKLIKTIEFRLFREVAAPISVEYWNCPNCDCGSTTIETTEDIEFTIRNPERGIVQLNPCRFTRCSCKHIERVVVSYKVNPRLMDQWAEQTVKDAISMLTAAELPTEVCGCEISDKSYIAVAQTDYNTITVNPITGNEVINHRYGFLKGQLTFAEKTRRVKKFKRSIRI